MVVSIQFAGFPTRMTKRVQFGCGTNKLEGFINHDSEVDVCKRLPYRDGSVDFVLCEHCVEHIPGPDALRFFDECFRILRKGGTLRICVPVLDRLTKEHGRDIVLNHGHLTIWTTILLYRVMELAGFLVAISERKPCDGHWTVIGKEKDDLETARLEGVKP